MIAAQTVAFGEYGGYAAWPELASAPIPAVIVLQEAWGVNEHIEDVTRRIAAAGYYAVAPDLFARNGARPVALSRERVAGTVQFFNSMPPGGWANPDLLKAALAKLPSDAAARIDESRAAIFGLLGKSAELLPIIRAAASFLTETNDLTKGAKLGAVGFCMGGGLSGLLACHEPRLSAAAVFYGMPPPVEEIASIACPILGFYGGLDARINSALPAFEAAMNGAGKRFEKHVYENTQHAFFNDGRPSYQVNAARDAWAHLLAFFRGALA